MQLTVDETIPKEVKYLEKYDLLKTFLDNHFEMPDKMVALLVRILDQGKGLFSERAKTKEFNELNAEEIRSIENKYQEIFSV